MMKVAALCDFPFWEGRIGSMVRFESLCRSLSKVCDLTAISTVTLSQKYAAFPAQQPYEVIDRSVLKNVHAQLPPGDIPGVAAKHQVSVRSITHLVSAAGFDAVLTPYFNREWMVEHLPASMVRIIDTHDCQSQRTRSFSRHKMVPTFHMLPEEEGAELDKYDIALAMSDEDHDEFAAVTQRPVITAPFRLPVRDTEPMRELYAPEGDNRNLLFVAADSQVNRLTLAYLLKDILPLVRGDVSLHIVGSVQLPDSGAPSNVTVARHENVEDLIPLYARSALAVNPTYAGGGVKTKTLEALTFGVPVVTTDEGARGLRHLIPRELIVNDKYTFAFRVSQLLEAPSVRRNLGRQQIQNLRSEDSESWLPTFAATLGTVRNMNKERYL
ncbi:glycosyltransferase [Roseovarius sp.]|uniref:glycosyltransferase n=1 Tax=Roseovarius sp. TaxID=1486281 RepID=UPI0035636FBF